MDDVDGASTMERRPTIHFNFARPDQRSPIAIIKQLVEKELKQLESRNQLVHYLAELNVSYPHKTTVPER